MENQHRKFPDSFLPKTSFHSANVASVLSQDPCASTHQSCSQIPSVYWDQRAKWLITWLQVWKKLWGQIEKLKNYLQMCKFLNLLKRYLKLSPISSSDFGKINSELQCRCSGPAVKDTITIHVTFQFPLLQNLNCTGYREQHFRVYQHIMAFKKPWKTSNQNQTITERISPSSTP